jgi:hypothetical protein
MPVGLEGVGAIDTAQARLARSTVTHAEEHAIFNSIPEESDLDPIALAEREFVKRGGRFREHEDRVIRSHARDQPVSANHRARCLDSLGGVASRTCRAVADQAS